MRSITLQVQTSWISNITIFIISLQLLSSHLTSLKTRGIGVKSAPHPIYLRAMLTNALSSTQQLFFSIPQFHEKNFGRKIVQEAARIMGHFPQLTSSSVTAAKHVRILKTSHPSKQLSERVQEKLLSLLTLSCFIFSVAKTFMEVDNCFKCSGSTAKHANRN